MLNKLMSDALLDISEEVRLNMNFHTDKEAQEKLKEELKLLSDLL